MSNMFNRIVISIIALCFCLFSETPSVSAPYPQPQLSLNAPLSNELRNLLGAIKNEQLNFNPFHNSKMTVKVKGWPTAYSALWVYQYPPNWKLLESDNYCFKASDMRGLALYTWMVARNFQGALSHDQIASILFKSILNGSQPVCIDKFETNFLAQILGSEYPQGVTAYWFVRWLHPQAGLMLGYLEVTIQTQTSTPFYSNTCANLMLYYAPENEFASTYKNIFRPMYMSSEYTMGVGVSEEDSDGDGVPDSKDRNPFIPHPDDPNEIIE